MKTLHFTLTGVTALLQHNPASMLQSTNQGISRKVIPTPEVEAEAGLYKQDGVVYIPAVWVRNSMLGGAKGLRINKMAASQILSGGILLSRETFPLLREGVRVETYDDIYLARVTLSAGSIIRARPRINLPWAIPCEFEYDEGVLGVGQTSIETIRTVLERAGRIVGIGDYRPATKGWFGRYAIEDVAIS